MEVWNEMLVTYKHNKIKTVHEDCERVDFG